MKTKNLYAIAEIVNIARPTHQVITTMKPLILLVHVVMVLVAPNARNKMKALILILTLTQVVSCSTIKTRWVWLLNGDSEAVKLKFADDDKSCRSFAYEMKVKGARYTEADIYFSCMQRKSYVLKEIAAN